MALSFKDANPRIPRVIAGALLAISVVMIAVYGIEGGEGPLHRAQASIHGLFAPLESVGANFGAAADDAEDAVSDMTASEDTLSALRDRNAELTRLLTQAEEYRLESERLQGLLELKDIYKIEGVSARVIGRSTDGWNQTITLDAGTDEGVEAGLTVMGPYGVIGQVMEASSSSSVVRLLSDPNSGVAALVQSSRVEGIVRGSLTGALYLENVDADATVNTGDVVLTSGLGGSFTKGLLIGTVVRVEGNANDGTRRIVVTPNEQAGALEEVMVVFSAAASVSTSSSASAANGGQAGASATAEEGGVSSAASNGASNNSAASGSAGGEG